MVQLSDMSQSGITALATKVTASENEWNVFKKDPQGYAVRNGFTVSLDKSAIDKIKSTSYADAKAKLTSLDLVSLDAKLW